MDERFLNACCLYLKFVLLMCVWLNGSSASETDGFYAYYTRFDYDIPVERPGTFFGSRLKI